MCCKYLDVKAARALSFLQLQPEENARVSQRWTSQTSMIPLVIQGTQQERSGHIAQEFHPVLEGGMVRTQFKCRWSGPAVCVESGACSNTQNVFLYFFEGMCFYTLYRIYPVVMLNSCFIAAGPIDNSRNQSALSQSESLEACWQ